MHVKSTRADLLICVAGVFALLQAYSALLFVRSYMTKAEFRSFFLLAVGGAAAFIFFAVVALTWAGEF